MSTSLSPVLEFAPRTRSTASASCDHMHWRIGIYSVTFNITSVDHKGVTCYGLRVRGVESLSLMTSLETRDLSGKADRSRVNNNTKRVGKSRHVDGGMFTTVAILNEKNFDH